MANFDTIKTAIDANIKTNGTQDITGGKMNSILKQMVDATDAELTELESEVGFDAQVLEFKPLNNTLSKKQLLAPLVRKGRIYRISILNPSWDMSGVTLTGGVGFGIGYFPKGSPSSNYTNLVTIPVNSLSNIQDSYTIEVTDDWEMLNIELRASEKVYIRVEDISNFVEFESKLDDIDDATRPKLDNLESFASKANYQDNLRLIYYDGVYIEQENASAFTTNYIPAKKGQEVIWTWGDASSATQPFMIFEYDENFNGVGYWSANVAGGQRTIVVGNENTKYIRASMLKGSGERSVRIDGLLSWIKMENGEVVNELRDIENEISTRKLTAHISATGENKIAVNIKAGESIYLRMRAYGVLAEGANCPLYYNEAATANLVDAKFVDGRVIKWTAPTDITHLILYVTGASFIAEGDATIEITDADSAKHELDSIREYVGNYAVGNVVTTSVMVSLPYRMQAGDKALLQLSADGVLSNGDVSCPLYYNGETLIEPKFTNGKTIEFTAKKDITSFDMYITQASFVSVGTIYINVYKKGGIFDYVAPMKARIGASETLTKGAMQKKAAEFCSLLNVEGEVEPFVFFTDPHLYYSQISHKKRNDALNLLRQYYNNIPANFILCGGDWLTNHKQSDALQYLGEIDGFMHKTFKNYYSMFGNHDNNYQGGIVNEQRSDGDEGIISNAVMTNLWYREYGKMYYTFSGTTTRFFVLDTGIDWTEAMDDYRWEQIDWLANLLKSEPKTHNAIAMHIVSNATSFEDGITPMADAVTKLANAYNTRSSIVLNGKTYDFTSSEGKIHVVICGHTHYDYMGQINGVPTFCTTQFLAGYTGAETFDMIVLDYANNKLRSVRVGNGSNRELDIVA